ncbi:MAG TPA: AAA family ATPase [Chitinophagaceae bacterium]
MERATELIERSSNLNVLESNFSSIIKGQGHIAFISGEAGIGKTSLVKKFCRGLKKEYNVYLGTCDALFTPRPIAPLYDILLQMTNEFPEYSTDISRRNAIFTKLFYELKNRDEPTVVIFEDINWADEATLDFIKFLARRITHLRCLFILTYRDDAINFLHKLRNIIGQLNPDTFTRIQLKPLSREVVEKMAEENGHNGAAIYRLSGGNPFYLNELLASYSNGIPENIKDSILSVYYRQNETTRYVWEILSVSPTGLEISNLQIIEPTYAEAIEACLDAGIMIVKGRRVHFKHELYRLTIETALSPLAKIALNKKILEQFRESFEVNQEIERIVHHAKNANSYDLVIKYAPLAASQAARLGAHIEASKLYRSAIECCPEDDNNRLAQFYELYAYECYLTNQITEAITFQEKALTIWSRKNVIERKGNSLRLLSRFSWFEGKNAKAENYALLAIEALDSQPCSKAKAMAFSNMSQLKMLADQPFECIFWGKKAIRMARELGDEEILSHALNNVGDVIVKFPSVRRKGFEFLKHSLEIALKNAYYEHVARAYTNLGNSGIIVKEYALAKKYLDEGLSYCEENGLESWTIYMQSCMARLHLGTGNWGEALSLSEHLLKMEDLPIVVKTSALTVKGTIYMRCGNKNALQVLLSAKELAFETMEVQRIIPVIVALLQYEYITGRSSIENATISEVISMLERMGNIYENSELCFWLLKARNQKLTVRGFFEGYQLNNEEMARKAAAFWKQSDCPFEQALALFNGGAADKREAISIMHQLNAHAFYDKMKQEMRSAGIKKIPRGVRKSTQSNSALLTERELDVLKLLKEGMQNKEIAARLFISSKTVDHHISSILFKLDVNSRVKAVKVALEQEILK